LRGQEEELLEVLSPKVGDEPNFSGDVSCGGRRNEKRIGEVDSPTPTKNKNIK